jgi:hypothetical protein
MVPQQSRTFRYAVFAVGLLVLSGCASSEESAIAQEYASIEFSLLEDNANKVVECVHERTGFTVTADRDGSVGYTSQDVPASQYSVVDAAIPACFEDLGFIDDGELSASQKQHLYELQKEALACLAREGYDLPEPPSLAVYVETYGTADHWAPWAGMGQYQLASEKMIALQEKCPDPGAFN